MHLAMAIVGLSFIVELCASQAPLPQMACKVQKGNRAGLKKKLLLHYGASRFIHIDKQTQQKSNAQEKDANDQSKSKPAALKIETAAGALGKGTALEKLEQEENTKLENETISILAKRIKEALDKIAPMPEGDERDYWLSVQNAYEFGDLERLTQLQKERPDGVSYSIDMQWFILSLIEHNDVEKNKKSDEIILSPMNRVRKTAFYRKITLAQKKG